MRAFFIKQDAQTGNSGRSAEGAVTTLNTRENQKILTSMGNNLKF